jgi:hypothetical protein
MNYRSPSASEIDMLRITIVDSPLEQRFVVEGKLTASSVSELESVWNKARDERRDRKCIVDLSGTTCIDQRAKKTLTVMRNEGARLTAKGVWTEHLIEDIERNCSELGPNADSDRR